MPDASLTASGGHQGRTAVAPALLTTSFPQGAPVRRAGAADGDTGASLTSAASPFRRTVRGRTRDRHHSRRASSTASRSRRAEGSGAQTAAAAAAGRRPAAYVSQSWMSRRMMIASITATATLVRSGERRCDTANGLSCACLSVLLLCPVSGLHAAGIRIARGLTVSDFRGRAPARSVRSVRAGVCRRPSAGARCRR